MNWFDNVPMTQVSHRLWVGGYVQAAQLAIENPKGITAVLDVSTEPPYEKNPNVVYQKIPFHDGHEIPRQQFAMCLGWLKFMYENGHIILIHCAAGISRSVTITASFMDYIGLAEDFDTALDRIRMARPIASPAPAVLVSAKKMLGAWPYDGSMEATNVPEHEKTLHDVIELVMAQRAAGAHPNDDCPMKQFLLTQDGEDNRPRHLIQCTCERLLDPLEVARLNDANGGIIQL